MGIKFDVDFKKGFDTYYHGVAPINIPKLVYDYIHLVCSNGSLDVAFNVAKASFLVDMDYQSFYAEAAKRLSWEVERADLDKFLFSVAFYYTFINSPKDLEKFLGLRFKPRDIYAEVAEAVRSDVETVKSVTTEHAYSIQLPSPESRDKWFYDLALAVGSNSKCHSRKIGAVLVKDNSVVSTGYNGPPRGIPTCDQRWHIDEAFNKEYGHHAEGKETEGMCPRRTIGFPSGQGLEICPAGHAERNALINAARLGVKTKKTKLYMTCGVPCTPCMVEIINAGVKEIICAELKAYDETAMYILENSYLKIRLFDFLV
jgi:dCMP deaminase